LDLGKSAQTVTLGPEGVAFQTGLELGWGVLQEIAAEERRVFSVSGDGLSAVQEFSETTGWLRTLCATSGAPTTLISGIPMHRMKDTDPMEDTRQKVAALRAPRGRVLDTATGLGYSALLLARTATEVVTIELDPAALTLAARNPWSQELFGPKIKQIVGDSFEEALRFDPGSFVAIFHDPPTLALGGELYSEEFYRRLFRAVRRGGRLFHYIGDPRSALGKKIYPGVMKRLTQVGFKKVVVAEGAHGVVADA
jgi:predicted methyltransferase